MGIKRAAALSANWLLAPLGAELVSKSEIQLLRRIADRHLPVRGPSFHPGPVPEGAEAILRPDHPRLAELRARYAAFAPPALAPSLWSPATVATIDLKYFRGDNAFVFQFQDWNAEVAYILTACYLRTIDQLGLLGRLQEDGLFGAYVFPFERDTVVSRDLLDSISEITFLEEALGLSTRSGWSILDIGAGYGRLAHRLVESLGGLRKVLCADAIAESTFLCEYYLQFRGASPRAQAVPLDAIEDALAGNHVDLAVNIHSFSECSLASAGWWLDLLVRHDIERLMIVPNPDDHGGKRLLSREPDGSRLDLLPALVERGYRLATGRPKYALPAVQRHGVSPTHFYLFELPAT
jgi:hypothetical protein